jgi:hypothetical protein
MEKEQFVSKLANRVKMAPAEVENLVDATLAELISPAIFGTGGGIGALAHNNCDNNCAAEQALRTSIAQR